MSLSLIAHIQGEMQSKILVVEWFDQGNGVIAGLLYSVLAAARRLGEGAHASQRCRRRRKAVPLCHFFTFPFLWLK